MLFPLLDEASDNLLETALSKCFRKVADSHKKLLNYFFLRREIQQRHLSLKDKLAFLRKQKIFFPHFYGN